ncbi:glycoside hydrolase family protein [Leptolyngbya sp. CCNP1308]|uniref:glycoside hydrolase family 24 protein n=1 Tax=Leptolyngbya sp. CCNP1308 TaxID=3110255 RepID=UPI002B1EA83E|nr:glycoside hydrolase family protein [Leptolyngbya sp. CCNP1308]MEA5448692.1 glycoside hydrolase family protein [Leptolyngbya sp. CCNP1308]
MTSLPSSPSRSLARQRRIQQAKQRRAVVIVVLLLLGIGTLGVQSLPRPSLRKIQETVWVSHPEPLAMAGGDPYIRALMRTISAAESNTNQPYNVLYGGDVVQQLNRHPDICIEIVNGPNQGQCTTAAGRYQFLTTTWQEKARQYHPKPSSWFGSWGDYSFDPESQDLVVYHWLKDASAWNLDIPTALRDDRLDEVLRHLSGTWTSLGYGIESNSMTARLPRIYDNLLKEELEQSASGQASLTLSRQVP